MGKITGGEVKYGRTVKTGDFENKRVDVALTFSVDDGEDHTQTLQVAAREAHDKAHAMLGIKTAPKEITPSAAAPSSPPEVKPPKSDKEAAAAAMNGKDAAKETKSKKEKAEKPEPAGEDPGFVEDAPENQPEISDQQITTALNKQMAVLKPKHGEAAGKKLRELIATFVEPPKKSHDIPQNLRAAFVKKLEELA